MPLKQGQNMDDSALTFQFKLVRWTWRSAPALVIIAQYAKDPSNWIQAEWFWPDQDRSDIVSRLGLKDLHNAAAAEKVALPLACAEQVRTFARSHASESQTFELEDIPLVQVQAMQAIGMFKALRRASSYPTKEVLEHLKHVHIEDLLKE